MTVRFFTSFDDQCFFKKEMSTYPQRGEIVSIGDESYLVKRAWWCLDDKDITIVDLYVELIDEEEYM